MAAAKGPLHKLPALSRKQTLKLLRRIAVQHGVELVFKYCAQRTGGYTDGRTITIHRDQRPCSLVHAFFHELGHVHCFRTGKYRNYHYGESAETERRLRLRAERWVARYGKKLYDSTDLWKSYGKYYDEYIHGDEKNLREWLDKVPA